ncbi:hypothetical protein BGZ81_005349 [Podila clonocystis]|nr:hypothetical protein BGZ81_005349 [Podila clonocystis]
MAIPKLMPKQKHATPTSVPPIATTPSARPSPLNIPEILERILSFLNSTTLLTLRCVCSQWYITSRRLSPLRLSFDDLFAEPETLDRVSEELVQADSFHWISSNAPNGIGWTKFSVALKHKKELESSDGAPTEGPLKTAPLREFYLEGMFYHVHLIMMLPYLDTLTSLRINSLAPLVLPIEEILRACPLLVDVHIEAPSYHKSYVFYDYGTIGFGVGAQGALEPQSGDPPLRLEKLTVRQCTIDLPGLVSVLAVSPRLQEIALVGNKIDRLGKFKRQVSHDDILPFLAKSCPQLRRVHYSFDGYGLTDDNLRQLIQGNPRVVEWSFLQSELRPALVQELLQVRNVVTYLELALFESSGTDTHLVYSIPSDSQSFQWINMTAAGLQEYLCASPLLLHLKSDLVGCLIRDIEVFPLQLQTMCYRPGVKLARIAGAAHPRPPRVWACRNLQSLSLSFTQTFGVSDQLLGVSSSQVVFGYLSRVCPKLRHLHLKLDDVRLNLAGGMCLLSRLDRLEQLTLSLPSFKSKPVWRKSMDLSWMARHPLPRWPKFTWEQRMRSWQADLKKEQGMIAQREEYMKAERENSHLRGEEVEMRSWGDDLAHPLSHLGTFADVHSCLKDMAGKEAYQCWPWIKSIWVESNVMYPRMPSKEFSDAVNKVRPGIAK